MLASIAVVALALVGCGGNRWEDRSIQLWPEPSAANRAEFLRQLRADPFQPSIDASAIPESDLVDGGRFYCAAMAIVQKENRHVPKQDDVDEAVEEITDRYNYWRAKVAASNDHPGLTDDDVAKSTASLVARYGLTAFCPDQKLDLLR